MSFFSHFGVQKPDPRDIVSQLHLQYSLFMVKFLVKKNAKPEIAKEIVQEVFINLYENFYSIKDMDAIKGWLIASAFNRYQHFLEKKSTKHEILINFIDSEGNKSDENPLFTRYKVENIKVENLDYSSSEEKIDCFKKKFLIFQKNNPEAAFVIEMDMDEMSGREIAQVIHRSEMATRTFLKESKKKLKPLLEECR